MKKKSIDKWSPRCFRDHMTAIGIKLLKSNLSKYFSLVKSGKTIYVSDRNEVIAEIKKISLDEINKIEKTLTEDFNSGLLSKPSKSFSTLSLNKKTSKNLDWKKIYKESKS